MSKAPVCLTNPSSITVTPIQRLVPNVPAATDLNSALAAINALRQLVYMLLNQVPANGQPGPAGPAGQTPQKVQSKFTQTSLVPQDVTIPVKDSDGNTIGTATVTQVNQLVLTNPVTLETWTYTRNG